MALYEKRNPFVEAIEQSDGNFLVTIPGMPPIRAVYSPERFHQEFKPVVVIDINIEGEKHETLVQESGIQAGEECNGSEGNQMGSTDGGNSEGDSGL